jgi:ferrochelatase
MMIEKNTGVLIVNFGGPRSLEEIPEFLRELLCDQDVIRTRMPPFVHRLFFSRIANKRAQKIVAEYQLIGGRSPIFEDTEFVAQKVREQLQCPVLTFHRYLPSTHADFLHNIHRISCEKLLVFPLFPQFSYATTGSIARWFSKYVKRDHSLRWIRSYAGHEAYISCMQRVLADYLEQQRLARDETMLFFSPHGLPQAFVDTGDPYEEECQLSFRRISQGFPLSVLAYQSKFGKGEWLRPYTNEMCENVGVWAKGARHVVFVPLSFTSDHIETLFEVEHQYLPILRAKGIQAYRCPALNRRKDWCEAIVHILEGDTCDNEQLIFHRRIARRV